LGRRLQARRGDAESRVVRRLTASYLAVFSAVIASLSAIAFFLMERTYRDVMEPVLSTAEGAAAFAHYQRGIGGAILLIDTALVLAVGLASYWLARAAVRPLALARAREERFAADIAHELRTPLSVIASVAQAAREDAGGPAAEALNTIARRALEAGELISDLLTLARGDGADVLDIEPVDFGALVARAAHDFDGAHGGVALESNFGSAIVDGDQRRLLQLARNLFANAFRHARSRVVAGVRASDGWATLTVEDDGPGVPEALKARLFQRFAKGSDSRGSGLGLAICRWVARSHGGDVTLEEGSRFVARVPLGHYPGIDSPV
jgi:two-component system OmpR family sensor kinase